MTLEHRHAILDALMTVLSEEHAEGVIEHRKRTIKKPFTVFAAKLLAKEFGKCPDANAAAEEMILRGWTGFKADWIKPKGPSPEYRQNARALTADINSQLFAEEPTVLAGAGETVARPLDEWHEDHGFVVWWCWDDGRWLGEPAWIGSPNCSDWPEYHTHWTPHPLFPAKVQP